jgi:hypothetical protein
MNPWKNFTGLSAWMMRIAVLLVIFTSMFPVFMQFDLRSPRFFVSAVFVVFGILLFVGGLLSKQTLTVVSGLILFIVSVLQAYWAFNGITANFALWILMSSAAIYFVSRGNK